MSARLATMWASLLVASPLGLAMAQSQVDCGGQSRPVVQLAAYPQAAIPTPSDSDVDFIRCLLNDSRPNWGSDALRFYFHEAYIPSLPDLVVYINEHGVVRVSLVKDGRPVHHNVLRGEKYVYLIVFCDQLDTAAGHPSAASHAATPSATVRLSLTVRDTAGGTFALGDTAQLAPSEPKPKTRGLPGAFMVSRTSTDYQTDPALTRLLYSFLSKLSINIGGNAAGASPLPDSSGMLVLDTMKSASRRDLRMLTGRRRFSIPTNTWNRIEVKPDSLHSLPGVASIVGNFANADASRFGAALCMCATLNAHTLNNDSIAGQRYRYTVYLLAHWYALRPTLPRKPMALGVITGTNLLDGNLLNDILFGVALDRLSIGSFRTDAGFAVGVNFLTSQKRDRSPTRLARLFAGVDFPL